MKKLTENQEYTGNKCPVCCKRLIKNFMTKSIFCESCEYVKTYGQLTDEEIIQHIEKELEKPNSVIPLSKSFLSRMESIRRKGQIAEEKSKNTKTSNF